MRRAKTGLLILVILLIIICLLGAIFYRSPKGSSSFIGKGNDYQQKSLAILEIINKFLTEAGLKSSLIKESAETKVLGKVNYILNYKVIKLSPHPRLHDYKDSLAEKVKKAGGQIYSFTFSQEGGEEIFTLRGGIGPLETFWLIFRQPLLPWVAIIIDDLGYGGEITEQILQMKVPLTLSILPQLPHSQNIARRAKEQGFQVLLHLPMEPYEYPTMDPGPEALLVNMEEDKIREVLTNDLKGVPEAVGVNNHMGSRFTANKEKMSVVLEELKKHNLFFIDSLTSGDSVGYQVAKIIGLPTTHRDIFLDNYQDAVSVRINLRQLITLAQKVGKAVAIGHPYSSTISVLQEMLPELLETVEIVPVSQLLEGKQE